MSGPKHAQIHNPMSDATRARTLFHSSANRARGVKAPTVDLGTAKRAAEGVLAALNGFTPQERTAATGYASMLSQAQALLKSVPSPPSTGEAAAMLNQAEASARDAQASFDRGQGPNATVGFTRAMGEADKARLLADREASAAAAAQAAAKAVVGQAKTLSQSIEGALQGARAQLKAEADLARAEAARDHAQAVVRRVEGMRHAKFAPGRLDALRPRLGAAEADLKAGRSSVALAATFGEIATSAEDLASDVAAAEAAWQREKAEAEAAHDQLASAFGNVDRSNLDDWSSDREAGRRTGEVLAAILRLIQAERFAEAKAQAETSRSAFDEAVGSMEKNLADAEATRDHMQTVIEVLRETDCRIGYDLPTRDKPGVVRAHGAATGGDVEFVFNPGGDVPFHHAGTDGSCKAAVDALVARLKADGGEWEMKSWGNYHGARDAGEVESREVGVRERVVELG